MNQTLHEIVIAIHLIIRLSERLVLCLEKQKQGKICKEGRLIPLHTLSIHRTTFTVSAKRFNLNSSKARSTPDNQPYKSGLKDRLIQMERRPIYGDTNINV